MKKQILKNRKLLTTSLLMLCILFSFSAKAQNLTTLTGTVKTADGKPAEYVTISIDELDRKTQTNESGEFRFSRLPLGTYKVTAKSLSSQALVQEVNLVAGNSNKVSFTLSETSRQLEEVHILSSKSKKLASKKTDYVARMPLENLENPQVYSVISKELLKEQVAIDIKSAVQNTPGAVAYNYPAGGVGLLLEVLCHHLMPEMVWKLQQPVHHWIFLMWSGLKS